MTGNDILTASLRLIGVLASGEPLGSSEATDGLASLNDLVESWSLESLLVNTRIRETFPLVAGQQSYTMGVGGNFNTARPQMIENALIQLAGTSPLLELPMGILSKDQYAGVVIKALQSTYPLYIYPENANPLETLNVWPVPNAVNNIVLYSWKVLGNFTDLTTTVNFPPGYGRALKYNMAVALAPEYGKVVPDLVAVIAEESKAAIARMNIRPEYLESDPGVMLGGRGTYDWRTDSNR